MTFVALTTLTLMIMSVSQHDILDETIERRLLLVAMPAVFYWWFLYGIHLHYKRFVAMFLDLTAHRAATVVRLRRLLVAARLSADEIEEWLGRVPPVPSNSR